MLRSQASPITSREVSIPVTRRDIEEMHFLMLHDYGLLVFKRWIKTVGRPDMMVDGRFDEGNVANFWCALLILRVLHLSQYHTFCRPWAKCMIEAAEYFQNHSFARMDVQRLAHAVEVGWTSKSKVRTESGVNGGTGPACCTSGL